jgi:hypothetical protein
MYSVIVALKPGVLGTESIFLSRRPMDSLLDGNIQYAVVTGSGGGELYITRPMEDSATHWSRYAG